MASETVRDQIRSVIASVPRPLKPKCGKELHDAIFIALKAQTSFKIVKEDKAQFLRPQMPVWRDKQNNKIEPTIKQRKIDIVIYCNELPGCLIEVESDLNDLQLSGVSSRDGHYDVFSIAKSEDGSHFHSYKSIERMAAAAIYHYLYQRDQNYPTEKFAIEYLESLRSDSPIDHNPSQLPMFLVSGPCRPSDKEIISARLRSLDAELICKEC